MIARLPDPPASDASAAAAGPDRPNGGIPPVIGLLLLLAVAPAPPQADTASRVRAEILVSWQAYERSAWGRDELRPVSGTARDGYGEPLLMTPVDALDTLLLAGFDDDEAAKAKTLVDEKLSFDRDASVQVFEVTIRLPGGLLSGYPMTGDERLLHLAGDLGRRLLFDLFDTEGDDSWGNTSYSEVDVEEEPTQTRFRPRRFAW